MKNAAAAGMAMLLATAAHAQQDAPRRVAWGHVLDAADGTAAVSYDWQVTPRLSATVGVGVGFGSALSQLGLAGGGDTLTLSGAGRLRLGLSWFFTGTAPLGTFLSPRLMLAGSIGQSELLGSPVRFGHQNVDAQAQLLAGHSLLFWNRVALQVAGGIGAGYGRQWFTRPALGEDPGGTAVTGQVRVGPAFEVAVGYAF